MFSPFVDRADAFDASAVADDGNVCRLTNSGHDAYPIVAVRVDIGVPPLVSARFAIAQSESIVARRYAECKSFLHDLDSTVRAAASLGFCRSVSDGLSA